MAKVKDQVYDGSEVTYQDKDGAFHFFGELFRHIMPDAYPFFSLNPTGIARKSPRGYRVPQQGRGTEEQAPYRECFQQCADRWNSMEIECPDPAPCKLVSSKANVHTAKVDQGVMCAYYDLFMGCCMSSCTEISIEGPGGVSFSSGTISENNNCWPCEAPCKTSILSIGYTTDTMATGSSQVLLAHDSLYGNSIPCCPDDEITWRVVSGGGYCSPLTGPSTTYHAPAANPYCALNPIIELSDCCGRTATLGLSLFGTPVGGELAGYTWFFERRERTINAECTCAVDAWRLNCDNAVSSTEYSTLAAVGPEGCLSEEAQEVLDAQCEAAMMAAGKCPRDTRSLGQLLAGCCPAQLTEDYTCPG